MSRPLLQARREFLAGWHPRVLLPDGEQGVCLLEVDDGLWSVHGLRTGMEYEARTQQLRVDPCRADIQDQVSRAWWGASGLHLSRHAALVVGGRVVAAAYRMPGMDALHVPRLAQLGDVIPEARMGHALVAVANARAAAGLDAPGRS